MKTEFIVHENNTPLPTIHVISDSVGLTAQALARAAAAQFGETNPNIEVLPHVRNFEDVKTFIDEHGDLHKRMSGDERLLIFYTLVDCDLRKQLSDYAAQKPNVVAVDLMTEAMDAIAKLSGLTPSKRPGGLHVADQHYFKRIEAIEFTIDHDDGRNPQEMSQADIVLLGVSRSSKTPTSIYLAQQGYKVSNVPLDPSTEPPHQIFDVDSTRIFGLMTTPDVLVGIRQRRLGNASVIASKYADPEYVYEDLEKARKLMRKLGCIVIHTENRAVEETAQEILRYYERMHPHGADMIQSS
jgi:[pyruvate, water dikinase]-phosphate phosphotransferase / [pyruvate, water dikinase] kinase